MQSKKQTNRKGPFNFVSQHGIATARGQEQEATTSKVERHSGIASTSLRLQNYHVIKGDKHRQRGKELLHSLELC